jgi:hypothetical protein
MVAMVVVAAKAEMVVTADEVAAGDLTGATADPDNTVPMLLMVIRVVKALSILKKPMTNPGKAFPEMIKQY